MPDTKTYHCTICGWTGEITERVESLYGLPICAVCWAAVIVDSEQEILV